MIIGTAALSLAALCLSVSGVMFSEFAALSDALARENAARDAMDITYAYFISDISRRYGNGEAIIGMQVPNPRPVKEIPRQEFAAVEAEYPNAVIEGAVIDLYYDYSFNDEALRLRVAQGRPIFVVVGGDGPDGQKYHARHYELRAKITSGQPPQTHSIKLGLMILAGSDDGLEVVELYTEQ